ncbi:MAG: hypothetical protein LBP35_00345 [Candidatus Ancillula trichonymphae]|jgi:hypothetical protein|nr:hypothetical protein [Candidatus Ancillula trichonymphae]
MMIYLKNNKSPEEYDQASFRLQSVYVKEYKDEKDKDCAQKLWLDYKPQTLLVDFDPARMYRSEETRAQIYNVNTGEKWQ